MRYHNGANGPAKCEARVRACPVGGDEVHFDDEKEARVAYEKTMAETHGAFTSVTRASEFARVESRAAKALADRDALGRAEAILASAEDDDDVVAMDRAWKEIKDLDSVKNYDHGYSTVEDLSITVDLARSDVEMNLQEYGDQLDSLEEIESETVDSSSGLTKLDPLSWESGPSQRFANKHGWHPYDDQWENYELPNEDKLHVVTNSREAPGESKFFVAKKKSEPKEFESLYRTPKEISRSEAMSLGYSSN